MEIPKLTQFSPGAGCGCKISPRDLEEILQSNISYTAHPSLLVGNESHDDAAVYDIGGGKAIISTTDFFTPIVDDPYDFGRIAATNAISDIYAMGGSPVMAIAVLGWPLDKLPKETARTVIEGARLVCDQAGIALSGGHSIDISDPVFGLAVTGVVDTDKVKKNNTATEGCELYLTKPIGIGIITTAQKKGFVNAADLAKAVEIMTTLNKLGTALSDLPGVKAMTDVTGFGLLGHLLEICEGSSLAAEIEFGKVPVIPGLEDYMEKKSFPGGTFRNWKSYGDKIAPVSEPQKHLLCDPQTSGGLLVAVDPAGKAEFLTLIAKHGLSLQPFGKMIKKTGEHFIKVF